MIIILASINSIYFASLIIIWYFFPAGPIFDLETDQIIGERKGLTWFRIGMLIPFSLISSWGFQ